MGARGVNSPLAVQIQVENMVLAVVNSPLTVQIQVAKKGTLRAPALSLTNDLEFTRGNDVTAWPSEPDFSRRGARMTVVANAQTPSNNYMILQLHCCFFVGQLTTRTVLVPCVNELIIQWNVLPTSFVDNFC